MAAAERPVFLYDGDCSFCSSCAEFIHKRISTTAEVVPWQHADLVALGVTQEQAEAATLWVVGAGERSEVFAGPEGIARLLIDAGSYWKALGRVLDLPPVRWLAWPAYRVLARYRHRMPGGTPACALPQAQRDSARGTDRAT